mmetsp:Transcript_12594/g.26562  ORF Transcript_12594/g.26562 Transcript_12594/m.26562 type:complete len:273 (-) Transcript_12594:59-877(-)
MTAGDSGDGKHEKSCAVCHKEAEEYLYCPAEQVLMCKPCDVNFHNSNLIFARHQRVVIHAEDDFFIPKHNDTSAAVRPNEPSGTDSEPADRTADTAAGTDLESTIEKLEKARLSEDRPPEELAMDILRPAVDAELLSMAQFSQLVDFEDEQPFEFICQLLNLNRKEVMTMLEQLRTAIYEGEGTDHIKKDEDLDVDHIRFLIHKMRGSAANLGVSAVNNACCALKEVFVSRDRTRMENGPGHYHDLVKACHLVLGYFERFEHFIEVHCPELA